MAVPTTPTYVNPKTDSGVGSPSTRLQTSRCAHLLMLMLRLASVAVAPAMTTRQNGGNYREVPTIGKSSSSRIGEALIL